jgi:hypothetical protein
VAKQAGGQVHGHKIGTTATHGGSIYVADVGVIGLASDTRHPSADIDVTITSRCEDSRLKTDGRVVVADSVVIERTTAAGRVLVPSRVAKECSPAIRHVEMADCVVKKRLITNGRIKGAGVAAHSCVAKECLVTDRRVLSASAVGEKRLSTDGCVAVSTGMIKKGNAPLAVLKLPLSLKTSASVPTAVFCVPVVLSNSAAAPTAVLESAVLRTSVPAPTPVLKLLAPTKKSEYQPTPVFPAPVVKKLSALHPSAVVNPG